MPERMDCGVTHEMTCSYLYLIIILKSPPEEEHEPRLDNIRAHTGKLPAATHQDKDSPFSIFSLTLKKRNPFALVRGVSALQIIPGDLPNVPHGKFPLRDRSACCGVCV